MPVNIIHAGRFSLRKLYPILQKMFVFDNGFRQLEPPHHLKGNAIGQTQFSAARLAAALRGPRMQRFIHKFHPAQWQHYVKKILHGVPTEPMLHQRPSFMHHVVRGHQLPPFPLRALKFGSSNRMKRIFRVQNGIEPGSVNEDRFHKRMGVQSAAAAANPRSWSLAAASGLTRYLPAMSAIVRWCECGGTKTKCCKIKSDTSRCSPGGNARISSKMAWAFVLII